MSRRRKKRSLISRLLTLFNSSRTTRTTPTRVKPHTGRTRRPAPKQGLRQPAGHQAVNLQQLAMQTRFRVTTAESADTPEPDIRLPDTSNGSPADSIYPIMAELRCFIEDHQGNIQHMIQMDIRNQIHSRLKRRFPGTDKEILINALARFQEQIDAQVDLQKLNNVLLLLIDSYTDEMKHESGEAATRHYIATKRPPVTQVSRT